MMPAEMDLVVDKELGPDHEEQDDADDYIRESTGNVEVLADLGSALVQHLDQSCRQDHGQRIEFPQPGHHDSRESLAADRISRDGLVQACTDQVAGQAAQCTGEDHRPDDHLVDVDADVPRCPDALAHDVDLIPLLGIIQVDIECSGQRQNDQDNQQVIVSERRQFAVLQLAQGRRSAGNPDDQEISDKEYDLVISFLTPHYFAAEKAKGKMKIAWIHTDYKSIEIDKKSEEKMWEKFDKIVSISGEVTKNFTEVFPQFSDKIIEVPNMHPADFINKESQKFEPLDEMPQGSIRLLSIGRYCVAKNFDNVPFICRDLIEKHSLDVKWYIIGYGTDEALIKSKIKEAGMENSVILLGKKDNPYPYIKLCDFYVQPSRFEGNAVTVNEALILGKKVIVTNYDTAKNQVENGVDGVIVPLENSQCAEGIAAYIRDEEKQKKIIRNVCEKDYSNASGINKIYELMR